MKSRITATRYHDFSAGHRVVGHENKCRWLHGHNYRVHFECSAEQLDTIGRVIDFGVIKLFLCNWLENNWDHKMLLWRKDPLYAQWQDSEHDIIKNSVYALPFNPTAENMAQYLLEVVGPQQLKGTEVRLDKVTVEETRKCSATATRSSKL